MNKVRQFTVELTNFAGPLDLLLSLIERRELEITEVAVGQVTGDYLRTIASIETIDERELMWFLDIATRLLGYKSRALKAIAKDSDTTEQRDNEGSLADLTDQLRRLKIIRARATDLNKLYAVSLTGKGDNELMTKLPPSNLAPSSLVDSWLSIKSRRNDRVDLPRHEVNIVRLDIDGASQRLLKLLKGQIQANQLMGNVGTPHERVERLLALLEMIKQNLIELMSEGEDHYVKVAA